MTSAYASGPGLRWAGGNVVTGVAPDRQRQGFVGLGVRRRTAKTIRPTHMRPPMAVPASEGNEGPSWPDLRNMVGPEGFYPYHMSEDLIGSYNRFSYTGRDVSPYKLMSSCRLLVPYGYGSMDPSHGPMGPWPHGPTTLRSHGQMDLWLYGLVALCPYGLMDLRY